MSYPDDFFATFHACSFTCGDYLDYSYFSMLFTFAGVKLRMPVWYVQKCILPRGIFTKWHAWLTPGRVQLPVHQPVPGKFKEMKGRERSITCEMKKKKGT